MGNFRAAFLAACIVGAWSSPCSADIKLFACEPEWAALAEEIGHGHVRAVSATTALQDPHFIQARPSLIARVRSADLVVCSGADLEIGWLPMLLQKAGNPRVQPGKPGYFEASSYVTRLDVPATLDRSQGDVHALGNPHVQTNPHNISLIAIALADRLSELDAGNAAVYRDGLTDFTRRWNAAIAIWEARGAPLRGKRIITHHKSWSYLEDWLGLREVANLEPLPGVPPTASHLSRLLQEFGSGGADFIVRAPFQDDRPSQWLQERSGIPALVLPLTVGGSDDARNLFSWFDAILDRLLQAQS